MASKPKYYFKLFVSIVLLLITIKGSAQNNYPALATVRTNFPVPVYLNDFYQPINQKMVVGIVFRDFNEPSWDVRLKITLSSASLKLETNEIIAIGEPINVMPGQLLEISGADLYDYLRPEVLRVSGPQAQNFNSSGRLAEGLYNICVEVLDFNSGEPISLPACTNAWVQLKEPPLLISPSCGSYVRPLNPQNIIFQWNPITFSTVENEFPEYTLEIFELTGYFDDPRVALLNGQALQIFESLPTQQTTYNYDNSASILEVGKRYVYRVKVADLNGRDLFKNSGFSEVCDFFYGYPIGGANTLKEPIQGQTFGFRNTPNFTWTATDRRVVSQPFEYKLKIVKLNNGQDSISAMLNNVLWHEQTMLTTYSTSDYSIQVPKNFDATEKFAWQVETYSDNQLVAESEVRTLTGPPLLDKFYASNYKVSVLRTDNKDLSLLKGRAFIEVEGKRVEAEFDSLEIVSMSGRYYLRKGVIYFDDIDIDNMILEPLDDENQQAFFNAKRVKLDKGGLFIKGSVQFNSNHLSLSGEVVSVETESKWFNFPDFKITGWGELVSNYQFDLLEPLEFGLKIDKASRIYVIENKYKINFEGEISPQENLNYSGNVNFSYPFKRATHVNYFSGDNLDQSLEFPIVDNANISMLSQKVIIDLSSSRSPASRSPDWKGIYFSDYIVRILPALDPGGQLIPEQNHEDSIIQDLNNLAWIDGSGFRFKYEHKFDSAFSIKCNGFNSLLENVSIDIQESSIVEGKFEGSFHVPVFNEKKLFHFEVPLSDNGFSKGYITDLKGYSFTFNAGSKDQKVVIKVLRAEFKGNAFINSTIDLYWPILGVKMEGVDDFNIWANQEIGFNIPNGGKYLSNQLNGKVTNFPIIVQEIAAGRNKNYYSFAATFQMNMSDDISGINGPPISTFYSTVVNSLIGDEYEPQELSEDGGIWSPVLGFMDQDQIDNLSIEDAAKVMEYNLNVAFENSEDENKEMIGNLISSMVSSDGSSTQSSGSFNVEIGTATVETIEQRGVFSNLEPKQAEFLKAFIEGFVDELLMPVTDKIDDVMDKMANKTDSLIVSGTDTLNIIVERSVNVIVEEIAGLVLSSVPSDLGSVSSLMEVVIEDSKEAVIAEIQDAISKSIEVNIRKPIVNDLRTKIPNLINDSIRSNVTQLIFLALEGRINKESLKNEIGDDLTGTIDVLGEYVFEKYFKADTLEARFKAIGDTFIKEFDWDNVLYEMRASLENQLTSPEVLAAIAEDIGLGKLSGLLNNADFVNNLTTTGASFSNALSFKDGKLKLDPSNIVIKTQWVEVQGISKFHPNDPDFGDIWRADINLIIKKPKNIPLKGVYINSKNSEGVPFWFAQVSADDSGSKLGGDISKSPKALNNPISLGSVDIMAATVRVYRHMREVSGTKIVPDPTVNYGGYFRFILFKSGAGGGEKLRINLEGNVVQENQEDAFFLDFYGDMQSVSKNPKVFEIDEAALVKLAIEIHYNGKEDHFLGIATVDIKDGICLSGYLEVETKPNYWHVHVGDENHMIKITPGCAAWGGAGYVKINQTELEVALGVSYMLRFEQSLKVGGVKIGLLAEAYAALGIVAGMQYKPDFKLLKAGLWLELYAKLMLEYKGFGLKGSLTLLEIYVQASLILYFNPPPSYLEGDLAGRIEILNGLVKANFKAHTRINM